jgi:PPOX class probable F420-dependent enzyme
MTPVAELSAGAVEFLSAGTRTGTLGFIAQDGRPLVAPVWFVVDKGDLVLNTAKDSAKGQALMRDPRVVPCVDEPRPPYGFVQVQGTSTLSENPDELLDIATRTGARYIGPDRAEEFGRCNGVPGEVVVRIRPTKVIAAFGLAE